MKVERKKPPAGYIESSKKLSDKRVKCDGTAAGARVEEGQNHLSRGMGSTPVRPAIRLAVGV